MAAQNAADVLMVDQPGNAQQAGHHQNRADIHFLVEALCGDHANTGHQQQGGCRQADPRSRDLVPGVCQPEPEGHQKNHHQPRFREIERPAWARLRNRFRVVRVQPHQHNHQQDGLEDAQHRKVQQQVFPEHRAPAMNLLGRANHDHVRDIGGQNGKGGQMAAKGRRQPDGFLAVAARLKATAVGDGQRDGDKQNNTPHRGRHDKAQHNANHHDAGDQPGIAGIQVAGKQV